MDYEYRATLIRVVDGDTVDLRISLGLDVYTDQRIRLFGINTPEINSQDPAVRIKAQAAKAFVSAYLPLGVNALVLRTHKDGREKYGRYLGELAPAGEEMSVNVALLSAGLAVPYMV